MSNYNSSNNKSQVTSKKRKDLPKAITIPLDYIRNRHKLQITLLDLLFYGMLYTAGLVRMGTDVTRQEISFSQWKTQHTIHTCTQIFKVNRKSIIRSLHRLNQAGLVGYKARIPRHELFLKFEKPLLANINIDPEQRRADPGSLSESEAFVLAFIVFRSGAVLENAHRGTGLSGTCLVCPGILSGYILNAWPS